MSIIADISNELLGMFLADVRLTMAILFLVACYAGLVAAFRIGPLIGGGFLLFGCLGILVEAVFRGARGLTRQ